MKLTTEQKEFLKELIKKFEYKQIEEILKGVNEGTIDVDLYIKPEWDYVKMNQVRVMLEGNPDIEFNDFHFNLFSGQELHEMNICLKKIDQSLLGLKEKANCSERKNEILKIIQRFVDRDFKEE